MSLCCAVMSEDVSVIYNDVKVKSSNVNIMSPVKSTICMWTVYRWLSLCCAAPIYRWVPLKPYIGKAGFLVKLDFLPRQLFYINQWKYDWISQISLQPDRFSCSQKIWLKWDPPVCCDLTFYISCIKYLVTHVSSIYAFLCCAVMSEDVYVIYNDV